MYLVENVYIIIIVEFKVWFHPNTQIKFILIKV